MRTFLSAVFLAAGVAFCVADEPKKADAVKSDKTVKEQYEALSSAFKTGEKELKAKFKDAKSNDDKAAIRKDFQKLSQETGTKAFELVKDNLKDAAALDALGLAMQVGNREAGKAAPKLVLENFVNDAKVAKMLPMLGQGEEGAKFLASVLEKSNNRDVKGIASYFILSGEVEQSEESDDAKANAAKQAAVGKKVAELIAVYGNVAMPAGRSEKTLTIADEAGKLKFFLENLVVGKVAPDAECQLLDGKKTKISDYRGKVVVLDIWATWCGPCRAMIPHEREMVEARKDKKFTLISVSADDEKATLEKFLKTEEMPWTHWWDGSGGKVCDVYQVNSFPTIYVLDAKGVIRKKNVRGKAMDEAVDELLKELDDPKGGSK